MLAASTCSGALLSNFDFSSPARSEVNAGCLSSLMQALKLLCLQAPVLASTQMLLLKLPLLHMHPFCLALPAETALKRF